MLFLIDFHPFLDFHLVGGAYSEEYVGDVLRLRRCGDPVINQGLASPVAPLCLAGAGAPHGDHWPHVTPPALSLRLLERFKSY